MNKNNCDFQTWMQYNIFSYWTELKSLQFFKQRISGRSLQSNFKKMLMIFTYWTLRIQTYVSFKSLNHNSFVKINGSPPIFVIEWLKFFLFGEQGVSNFDPIFLVFVLYSSPYHFSLRGLLLLMGEKNAQKKHHYAKLSNINCAVLFFKLCCMLKYRFSWKLLLTRLRSSIFLNFAFLKLCSRVSA